MIYLYLLYQKGYIRQWVSDMINILKTANGNESLTCQDILYLMKARVRFFKERENEKEKRTQKMKNKQKWGEFSTILEKAKPQPCMTSVYEQITHLKAWTDFTNQFFDILKHFLGSKVTWWRYFQFYEK